jgi:hypothetical protein
MDTTAAMSQRGRSNVSLNWLPFVTMLGDGAEEEGVGVTLGSFWMRTSSRLLSQSQDTAR